MEETKNLNTELGEEEIDLNLLFHDIIRGFVKYWWLLILIIIVAGNLLVLYTYGTYKPLYESKASFSVSTESQYEVSIDYSAVTYDKRTALQMAKTFPYLLETELLTDMVKYDLGTSTINGTITASVIENSNLFTLSVRSSDPNDSKMILDSVIKNYPSASQYVMGSISLNLMEISDVPDKPVNRINLARTAAKGALIGVLLSAAFLFAYAILRKTVRNEAEIKNKLNMTDIGSVPMVRFKRRADGEKQRVNIHNKKCGEPFREAIRKIAVRLSKELSADDKKVLAVVAASSGEGSSMAAENIAAAIAETDKSVLLIREERTDKDMRFDPLKKLLNGESNMESCMRYSEGDKMYIITEPSGLQALNDPSLKLSFSEFIDKIKTKFDYIVIDSGTGSSFGSITATLPASDAVLVVIKQDTSTASAIREFIDRIRDYDVTVSGCVLNGVEGGSTGYGYGYGGYGGYGYGYGGYGYGRYGYSKYGYSKYGYGKNYGSYGSYGKDTEDDDDD